MNVSTIRGGGLTGQPVGPLVDTATTTTVMSTKRVESGSFSSGCCAFRRAHTKDDPTWLICIRLALSLTVSLLSRFAPSAIVMVCISPQALWLEGRGSCDCMLRDERGGRLTRQSVGRVGRVADKATITTGTSTICVKSGRFSSRCCALRRTHTSADPIQLLYIRPALPLTLFLPSGFAPSARLVVYVSSVALGLAEASACHCMFWDERGGGLTRQLEDPLWWVQQPRRQK